MKKSRLIIIIVAAIIIAGIGFGAGMMVKSSVASGAELTADEAKQIALSSVGVSAEKATFTKSVFDDGVYEIDFYTESNEYDFEVAADTGAIIERDVSPRGLDVLKEQTSSANDDEVIGVAAAKQIALDHAGISSASFVQSSLDYDDGTRVYDIEFTADNKEYDYEINAYTGKIIEYDIERFEYDD